MIPSTVAILIRGLQLSDPSLLQQSVFCFEESVSPAVPGMLTVTHMFSSENVSLFTSFHLSTLLLALVYSVITEKDALLILQNLSIFEGKDHVLLTGIRAWCLIQQSMQSGTELIVLNMHMHTHDKERQTVEIWNLNELDRIWGSLPCLIYSAFLLRGQPGCWNCPV